MVKKESPYHVLRLLGEAWLVPEDFASMRDLKRAVQTINDNGLLLTAKESQALQALMDNPYLIRIKR